MKPLPDYVADLRAAACGQHACTSAVDYADPCASCPNGHFGPTSFACRDEPLKPLSERALPSLGQMTANLVKASAAEAAAILRGVPAVSEEEAQRRFTICQANQCGHYIASSQRCSHSRCGCYLREKTAWRAQSCPVGKW